MAVFQAVLVCSGRELALLTETLAPQLGFSASFSGSTNIHLRPDSDGDVVSLFILIVFLPRRILFVIFRK